MKNIKYILSLLMLSVCISVPAQSLMSGYFADNYKYAHQLNPALASDQAYVGFLFSNLNFGVSTNLGFDNFIHKLPNGQLGSFMHPDVSVKQALRRFSESSYVNADFGYNIANVGINIGKTGFLTVDLGVKVHVDANIPYELFHFLKEGMGSSNTTYHINGLQVYQYSMFELAGGYSFKVPAIPGNLRIGGKLKMQFIADDAAINVENMDITMSDQIWQISTRATAGAHIFNALYLKTDKDGYVKGIGYDNSKNIAIAGIGLAMDLGAQYKFQDIVPGLEASIALQNVQLLRTFFKSSISAYTEGDITYSGFNDLSFEDDNEFDHVVDDLEDQLDKLTRIKPGKVEKNLSDFRFACPTLTIAARYSFLKDKMHVGLLYKGAYGPLRADNMFMLNWNVQPKRNFCFSLSLTEWQKNLLYGWLINFTPENGVNFFLGMEGIPFFPKYKNFIPGGSSSVYVQTGFSVPIGKRDYDRLQ